MSSLFLHAGAALPAQDVAPASLAAAEQRSSLSQYGITWTFDRSRTVGQYVTGDWWVVGPVTITRISPAPSRSPGRNGSQRNPRFGAMQGYDDRSFGGPGTSYDGNLCALTPIALLPGDSLVSTVSNPEPVPSSYDPRNKVKAAAVLTVVDGPQAAGRFRPPYCRPTRAPQSGADLLSFSADHLDWNRLLRLPRPTSPPAIATSAARFARPWIDHFSSWSCTYVMPADNMPLYGQWWADQISEASLQLLLDYPPQEKWPTLIGLVQLGIDLYGTVLDNGEWTADAGIFQGRKWPILLAGLMLNHPGMQSPPATITSGGVTRHRFAEDGQTYYPSDPALPQWVDNRGVAVAQGSPGAFRCRSQVGWIQVLNGTGAAALWRIREGPSWSGVVTEAHEHLHVRDWRSASEDQGKSEAYRRANTSMSFIGYALAARLMNARPIWNHNAFFDYCDRWMTEDDTAAYNAYVARWGNPGYWPRQRSARSRFIDSMWALYRGMAQ